MHPFKRNDGFTLIEVIIAVALVAIMAVAIAPPLVQNIKQGKVTRAQSDVQAIGTAILNFYKDVGEWPFTSPTGGTLNRLVVAQDTGSAIVGAARGDFFTGSGDAAGELAGVIRHAADFHVLVPKPLVTG